MGTEFTRLSSKGQIVIPQEIRREMKLSDGTPFSIMAHDETIILKRIKLPEIKTWKEATAPFRRAAKKSGLTMEELNRVLEEVRRSKK